MRAPRPPPRAPRPLRGAGAARGLFTRALPAHLGSGVQARRGAVRDAGSDESSVRDLSRGRGRVGPKALRKTAWLRLRGGAGTLSTGSRPPWLRRSRESRGAPSVRPGRILERRYRRCAWVIITAATAPNTRSPSHAAK